MSIRAEIGRLALALATLCAAAAVAAHGGRFNDGLDVLSHLAPLYVVGGLTAAATAIVGFQGRKMTLVLALLAIIAGGALIAPALSPLPPRPPSGPTVKVIQINALRANPDIGAISDWIIAERPDIVTVTEARHDLRDLILERTKWRTAGSHGHLIIFTRESYLRMDRPRMTGSELTFVNATYAGPGGPFEVVTTHLEWPTSPRFASQQVDVVRVLSQLPQERMILTGDFNAAPWSFGLRRLERRIRLTRRDLSIPTWPARIGPIPWPWPFLPIDHVYAGPGWKTVSVERGPSLGSDHHPLVITLAPAAQP